MTQADGKSEKPSTALPGTLQKIIKPIDPQAPEQVEIAVDKAEELYREFALKILW